MTTKEEYELFADLLRVYAMDAQEIGTEKRAKAFIAGFRALRALADGAVLCKKREYGMSEAAYYPIEELP